MVPVFAFDTQSSTVARETRKTTKVTQSGRNSVISRVTKSCFTQSQMPIVFGSMASDLDARPFKDVGKIWLKFHVTWRTTSLSLDIEIVFDYAQIWLRIEEHMPKHMKGHIGAKSYSSLKKATGGMNFSAVKL